MASTSNRVGHPVRTRKRNRNIYNEDEETSFGPQNRFQQYAPPPSSNSGPNSANYTFSSSKDKDKGSNKQLSILGSSSRGSHHEFNNNNSGSNSYSGSPSKSNRFNKNIGASLTISLKTLLKLPKAHNWVNHEWFYGNIDQVLFLDENEFSICLRDSFPQLRTRYLTRAEWSQIRRLMGKPRRCSGAFFEEERATLNARRQKIRHLQQNKVADLKAYKDLPESIPHPLVVGTNVAALARVFDGLYFGVVEGIDSTNGTYRVAFNRPDVGCHSIPDFEVASMTTPVMAPLASFEMKPRKPWQLINKFVESSPEGGSGQQSHSNLQSKAHLSGDRQLQRTLSSTSTSAVVQQQQRQQTQQQQNQTTSDSNANLDGAIGGFPIRFLLQLVKASGTLTRKRKAVAELRETNTAIERMTTYSEPISYSFKKSYALSILELSRLNKDVARYLGAMQSYSLQMAGEGRRLKSLKPDVVSQKCLVESKALVERLQATKSVRLGSSGTASLIVHLMSLLFHLRAFRDSEVSCYELQSLTETIAAIRKQIAAGNVEAFTSNVEIHIRHIMSSVSHLGNVGAFSESVTSNGSNGSNGNGSNGSGSTFSTETKEIKSEV